jgi:monomeric isocitrate dehydrogenase
MASNRIRGTVRHERSKAPRHHLHEGGRGPELASASLLPIVRFFAAAAGISVETRDISLPGASWPSFRDI